MRLPPSRATFLIGGITAAAWIVAAILGATDILAVIGGFIPERLFTGGTAAVISTYAISDVHFVPVWLTPLTATLLHGGLLHLAFNLLMLIFCGRFVEVALGARGLAILYVVSAYVAAGTQLLVNPHDVNPMIGASGAISALFGAYSLLFGERRHSLEKHRFGGMIHIVWLAAAWTGFQLLVGYATAQEGTRIAIAAHIGGFVVGLILARPLARLRHRVS